MVIYFSYLESFPVRFAKWMHRCRKPLLCICYVVKCDILRYLHSIFISLLLDLHAMHS